MTNPLLTPSTLPCELPDFAAIQPQHFPEAFEAAMAADLAAVKTVVECQEPPTLADTLEVLEREGLFLDRVESVFFTLTSSHLTDDMQELYEQMAPRLSQHRADVTMNRDLYDRVVAVSPDGLSPTEQRVLAEYTRWFERSGVLLEEADQTRLREINDRLSALSIRYSTQLVRENERASVHVTDRARLKGLSEAAINAAKRAAEDAGHSDGHLLSLAAFTTQPVLRELHDRALRQEIHQAAMDRGRGPDGATGPLPTRSTVDLRPIAAEVAELRAEQAHLLGYTSHDDLVMSQAAAGSPSNVQDMLAQVAEPAVRNAVAEREALQELQDEPLAAWDWPFLAERTASDSPETTLDVRDYLELYAVVEDGLFHTARELFGLEFTKRRDLKGYLPEVEVYECQRAETGETLGLMVADWWTRPTKSGGAWMGTLVHQNHLGAQKPVITVNTNFVSPQPGQPKLLTVAEVTTLFHEFGHVLHGLLSDVHFPSFAGTKVARDVVEFPSQVYEMWVLHPDVLPRYARHHRTGEQLPEEIADRLREADTQGQGFATVEYLAATAIDLAWHERTHTDPAPDLETFDQDAMTTAGLDVDGVDPRYTSATFKHIFAGGYAAGYYSYLWSEIIDAAAVEWFNTNGGLSRSTGDRFASTILSRGNEADPMDGVRELLGGDPDMQPLLQRRGLLS
ncbi:MULTISPECIES: M3 family metallopeptidase [Kocuria]|uniref:M3 family metallopeptidase n=1 Tax=Kocuria subflava TaxID=1736139 RepID=A0A846TS77_9MICC|nr:M3 family metallopeptidase [Kocuria sp. CPCC 104605]NKE08684.1 M3 family metallopeptidase [Kocuria subflava]